MKVLYILSNYPQVSESYIEAEIAYVRSQGVTVEVWSEVIGYGDHQPVAVHRGALRDAITEFCPDIVHIHYLGTAADHVPSISNVPVTVRAHSFDWSHQAANRVALFPAVRAIYAFPHFVREISNPKFVPLPVAYDAPLYDAPISGPVCRDRVIRLSAGKRMKGLEDFLAVSKLVNVAGSNFIGPGTFHLAVGLVSGDEKYIAELREIAHGGVHIHVNLGRKHAVDMIRTAGVYLDTSDPAGHPFGMPISVAEALASGLVVVLRDSPAAREFAGNVGAYYSSVDEAAMYVSELLKMTEDDLAEIRWHGTRRARKFRSDIVLPKLVEDWKRFAGA